MRNFTLWLGPLLAVVVGLACWSQGLASGAATTAGVAVLCAIWWVAQPIPIPVTSLVPIALFPLLGLVTASQVGEAYGHPLILLFLGGFVLSTALEKSGGHRRLALAMVRLCALGPRAFSANTADQATPVVSGRRLVLGFMLASGGVSMWVSNSATALMLLPIAIAALEGVRDPRLRTALLLSIAYGASIGGVVTPIGSPPNLLCMQQYAATTGAEPAFTDWMAFGLPVSLVMLPFAVVWLTRGLGGPAESDLPEPGPWRPAEVRTLAVFGLTALLWVTRKGPFGGWSEWTGLTGANDASVALLAVVALFLIPSGDPPAEEGEATPRLLDWQTAVKIPWGMLLLFSGGMVLATGFGETGLSDALGESLHGLASAPTPVLVGGICLAVTFLTEVTSNTATTAMLMPVLAAMAQATGLEPSLLMFPAAVSASFAFMLPVATPPNAAVYGAGVEVRDMAREGLALNLIGAVVITVLSTVLLG